MLKRFKEPGIIKLTISIQEGINQGKANVFGLGPLKGLVL